MKELWESPMGRLTVIVGLGLVLPALMMDGMFMDAVMYSAVGHNLAMGEGTFWFPFFSEAHMAQPGFHENPPLGYGIFALFYTLFGSSIYVERFYVLLTFLLTAGLIAVLWKRFFPGYKSLAWLPLLIWVTTPIVHWSFQNNMMENTMGVFVLLSVLYALKSLSTTKYTWLPASAAGICALLAFLVKGPPGLFVLAVPPVYYLATPKRSGLSIGKTLCITAIVSGVALGGIALLFVLPQSGESLSNYLMIRTLNRIQSLPTTGNRFEIVGKFLQQIILPVIVVFVLWIRYRLRGREKVSFDRRTFLFLLILGLCGVLPFMLTQVQRTFYLVPAMPLIAMAVAVILANPATQWQEKLNDRKKFGRITGRISVLLLVAILATTLILAGTPKRDARMLADVHKIGNAVGSGQCISVPGSVNANWSAKAYLVRLYRIQMNDRQFGSPNDPHKWILIPRSGNPDSEHAQPVAPDLHYFRLYRIEKE